MKNTRIYFNKDCATDYVPMQININNYVCAIISSLGRNVKLVLAIEKWSDMLSYM